MEAKDLIGKTIIDILGKSEMDKDGMDYFDGYLVLENNICVRIPRDFEDEMDEEFPGDASSLMANEYVTYFNVNPNQKDRFITWIVDPHVIKKDTPVKNALKEFKGQRIKDMLKFHHDTVFIELENGYIFSEQNLGLSGLGLAELFWYKNIMEMEERKGKNYRRLSTIN